MGDSLNGEMQLLSRKMGDGEEKEEILGQTEKEQLSETSRYIKPLSYVNHAHMGLYESLWAVKLKYAISLWHYL